jgi:hypothetical protein
LWGKTQAFSSKYLLLAAKREFYQKSDFPYKANAEIIQFSTYAKVNCVSKNIGFLPFCEVKTPFRSPMPAISGKFLKRNG